LVFSPALLASLAACGGSSSGVSGGGSEDAGSDATVGPGEDGGGPTPGEDASGPAGQDGGDASSGSADSGEDSAMSGEDASDGSATDAGPGSFTLLSPSGGTVSFGSSGNVACPPGNGLTTPTALTPAAPQTVQFSNTGGQPMTWTASVTTSYFTLSESGDAGTAATSITDTLAPGDTQTLTVIPSAIPWPASTAPNAYGDTLTITTQDPGDVPHGIALSQTAQGAVIATTNVATGFGTVYLGAVGNLQPAFDLQNDGNGSANITISQAVTAPAGATPSYFLNASTTAEGSVTVAVAPGTPAVVSSTFQPGSSADGGAADAVTSTDLDTFTSDSSPLCAPLPTAISLSGTGTQAQATYAPSGLSFANVPCGTTATPQTITFSNYGNAPYTITSLSLSSSDGGSTDGGTSDAFYGVTPSVSTLSPGVVPAANGATPGTFTITVTPTAIPAMVSNPGATFYDDTLTVTYVTGITTNTATFPLNENPYGAVLAPAWQTAPAGTLASSATDVFWFGTAQQNLQSPGHPAALSVANTGNATATMQLAFASGSSGPFNFPTSATSMPVGSSDPYVAWSQPTSANAVGSTFSANGVFTVAGPNCGPASFTTTLGGEVAGTSQIYVQPTSAKFGAEPCNASSIAPTTITINNHAPYPYTWNATLPSTATIGNVTSYLLSQSTGTIAAGGGTLGTQEATFTVVPNTAALAASALPLSQPANYFNTAITITFSSSESGAVAQDPITIPLTVTPTGAVLEWPQSNYGIVVRKGSNAALRVLNRGNATGSATLTLAGPDGGTPNFSFAAGSSDLTFTTSVNAKSSATANVFNTPPTSDSTASVTMTAGSTVLCAPLPASPASISQ
jgi:hypothetical protein